MQPWFYVRHDRVLISEELEQLQKLPVVYRFAAASALAAAVVEDVLPVALETAQMAYYEVTMLDLVAHASFHPIGQPTQPTHLYALAQAVKQDAQRIQAGIQPHWTPPMGDPALGAIKAARAVRVNRKQRQLSAVCQSLEHLEIAVRAAGDAVVFAAAGSDDALVAGTATRAAVCACLAEQAIQDIVVSFQVLDAVRQCLTRTWHRRAMLTAVAHDP